MQENFLFLQRMQLSSSVAQTLKIVLKLTTFLDNPLSQLFAITCHIIYILPPRNICWLKPLTNLAQSLD